MDKYCPSYFQVKDGQEPAAAGGLEYEGNGIRGEEYSAGSTSATARIRKFMAGLYKLLRRSGKYRE